MDGGFAVSEEDLVSKMLRHEFEGVTISGGEPFLQAAALAKTIRLLREKRDAGVIVYTGYTYEELLELNDPGADALLRETDLLIDGPFVEALNDDGGLRGSSNQRAVLLTDRYAKAVDGAFGKPGTRRQQVHIDPMGVLLVGLRNSERRQPKR